MRMMFVHGIGFHEEAKALQKWSDAWSAAIRQASEKASASFDFDNPLGADTKPGPADDPGILYYEKLILDSKPPNTVDYLKTVSDLLRSYVATTVGGWFRRDRGMLIDDETKWKARQIAAWTTDDVLREKLRKRVVKEIRDKKPDIVLAHSFGGLITYDACLFEDPDLLKDCWFVTLGTQIGNPLLRREFGGRQLPVNARHWFNLYNPGDRVFVAPLDHIRDERFTHVVVPHDQGHDGAAYLGHAATGETVWRAIAQGEGWLNRTRELRAYDRKATRAGLSPGGAPASRNRALLIGIDQYESPEISPLQGCVNDTYLLSAALQEGGIKPREIRILHNARATKSALMEGLRWLLDDVRAGDHRIFCFSGHGHRLPAHDVLGEADQMEEILVTYDYDFSDNSGLRDRDFQRLYADLPTNSHLLMVLDCCHSGGIARSGGPLVRALSGPSDVEHACVRWNVELQMWEQVGLSGDKGLNEEFLPTSIKKDEREEIIQSFYGTNKDLRRIGRATTLRDVSFRRYDTMRATLKKLHPKKKEAGEGPYLPVVFMACREVEKACEYVHGSVSYGAFTFAIVQALRDTKHFGAPTYGKLLDLATTKLKTLGYPQNPDILAHPNQKKAKVPFGAQKPASGAPPAPPRPRRKAAPKAKKKPSRRRSG